MSELKTTYLPKEYKKSVERIYSEYKKLMYYTAMKFVNNTDHADDIVHSAFLRIIKHIKKIESFTPQMQKGYIIYIVRNLSIDFLKQSENILTVPFEKHTAYIEDDKYDTERIVISKLEIKKVMDCIDNLEPKYSTAVFHRYVLGFSMIEIAKMLDITVENARVRCHRGRKKLLSTIMDGESNG